ncbi:FAD/NAD(P)-binding domain-containing protein [Hymenopellis radicata]|nr:FAD/NAD(P)-binding domain-containing protein [Hymenopellis radicata]
MADTYDIIFAGVSGTAACVTAGRLAELLPSLRILIIEPGPHTANVDVHVQPARYLANLVSETTFSRYSSEPSDTVGGRKIVVPTGKCVAGGSAVNFMMYTRASASDYDDWEKLGNPGWGSKDLIPLACKLESYEPFSDEDMSTHGSSGPIQVSPGGHRTDIGEQFLEMAAKYDRNRSFAKDINDFRTCDSYGVCHESGRRSDTAHSYIYNKRQNANLVILTGKRVKRVIFEGITACGVECIDEGGSIAQVSVFKAVHLVVLSAGAFGSPTILERYIISVSLKKSGIDHNLYFPAYIVDESTDTMNDLFGGIDKEAIAKHEALWKEGGRGLMAHNGIDAEVASLGSDFQDVWNSFYAPAPINLCITSDLLLGEYIGRHASNRRLINMLYYAEYLKSIGRVHIASADPHTPPYFNCGYLTHKFDVIAARWAYKRTREYIRRMACYKGDHAPDHPQFPAGSPAAAVEPLKPVDPTAPDIVYSKEDDEAIDAWHHQTVETTFGMLLFPNALKLCAEIAASGVVDPRLNVYGVKNLKVAGESLTLVNGLGTY